MNAVINSLAEFNNSHDLVVVSHRLPREYQAAVSEAGFPYRVLFQEIPAEELDWIGEVEVLLRKRYAVPAELDYDAYCILDADMYLCGNLERYLSKADHTGFVLGCTLEQKRRYGGIEHQYPAGSGRYLFDPTFWNSRGLCAAPLFVGCGVKP